MGQTASINELWEGIYNLSPDILLYKDGNLLLFEVDSSLNSEYLNKLKKYKKKENELISRLEIILNVKIDKIDYGFIAKSVQIPESIPIDLYPFTYMGYDKETHTLKGKIYKTG
ncbi:hypothetical protein SAMN05421687_103246 [Salimicrobium flavidum]|uniref:Uncharacterized protein n=2 Tax=Salimicrobium flavidum TaxID=570947 RepID=A0A1N7J2J8_9BACI|nr:hypothetical protein SAMN05421687_103246 [Salimicrobium flavidum]